jgi:hypothetical protein
LIAARVTKSLRAARGTKVLLQHGLQKLEGAAAGEVFLAGGTVVSCLEEHGFVHIQIGQEVLQMVLDNLPDNVNI